MVLVCLDTRYGNTTVNKVIHLVTYTVNVYDYTFMGGIVYQNWFEYIQYTETDNGARTNTYFDWILIHVY